MNEAKAIVAENLMKLRKSQGLTQAQLAEKFNYSDKAICRWERGETLPDINTLCSLAEFYGVTMNDLVDSEFDISEGKERREAALKYRTLISVMLVCVVWLCATVIFSTSTALFEINYWNVFIWSVPISCIVITRSFRGALNAVFKSIIYSVLIWSLITAVYLHFLAVNHVNIWTLFIIGVPLEAVVILWQQLKRYKDVV